MTFYGSNVLGSIADRHFEPGARNYSNIVAYQNELAPEQPDSQIQQKLDNLLTMVSSQKETLQSTVTSVESLKDTVHRLEKTITEMEKENVASKTPGKLKVPMELSVRNCLI